jgi:hypothetical protein
VAANSNLIKRLGKGVLGLAGLRLLDWVEVFYLPDDEIFVPIISKSGCSTIKEALIQKFKPGFESAFPEIHQVDPAKETNGKVLRLKFYQYSSYAKFARGKEMHLVLRDPAERFISCYKDVATGKNIMYRHPSEIYRWMPFKAGMSFEAFSKQVYKTPDYMADRHFRSQSFCLNEKVSEQLSELRIYSLSQFIKNSPLIPESYRKSKRKLNKSTVRDVSHPEPEELNSDPHFRKKYARDIHFFEETL